MMEWIRHQTRILDGADVTDIPSLHRQLKEKLSLPDYYGGNLDALYDCLTEMSGTIRIYHLSGLRRSLGAYADKLLRVFRDSESEYLHFEFFD